MNEVVGRVSELFYYPVKGCAGVAADELEVDEAGPTLDRRFVVVDDQGVFRTQRRDPKLALLEVSFEGGRIRLRVPRFGEAMGFFGDKIGKEVGIRVWNDEFIARSTEPELDEWMSEYLGKPSRLIYLGSSPKRVREKKIHPGPFKMSGADSGPFLLTTSASLGDLNSRLEVPVPMSRFRPNIVVESEVAFAEDSWPGLRIGDVEFPTTYACERCVVTTIDQQTLEKSTEPLATLSRFRRVDGRICFGMRMIHAGPGTLRVGDEVVLSRQ